MKSFIKIITLAYHLIPLIIRDEDVEDDVIIAKSVKFRETLHRFGPAYIKFGQILSTRFDFLHKETCFALQNLLDSGIAMDMETIRELLHKELKIIFKQIKHIDPKPLGVASIGQVHRGILKSDEVVAIKIQKPRVAKIIKRDIFAIKAAIKLLNFYPPIKKIPLKEFFEEFEKATLRELDYEVEASNLMKFKQTYAEDKSIYVPKVYLNLSTKRILVMEFLEGVDFKTALRKFHDEKAESISIGKIKITKVSLVKQFTKTVFDQTFKYGVFHGDPHPSNIFILKDKRLAFLDFGLVIKMSDVQIKVLQQILYDLSVQDRKDFVKGLLILSHQEGRVDEDKILDELGPLFYRFESSLSFEYSPTQFFLDVIYKASGLGVKIPSYIVHLAKVLAIYDGMLYMIDKNLNLIEILSPHIGKKYITDELDKLDLHNIIKSTPKITRVARSLYEFLETLPESSKKLLEKFEEEERHKEIENDLPFYYLIISLVFMMLAVIYSPNTEILGVKLYMLLFINWLTILFIEVRKFLVSS